MDDRTQETALSLTKFGIGQPVRRSEDPTLVRGQGRYTDDVNLPGQAYAVMVRSRDAHGVIRGIDTAAAKAMPGVLAVLTGADLKDYGGLKCLLPLKSRDGSPIKYRPRPALATDKVRFVGDPVACVVAETIAQAKDAAEAVALDIEPLPAVVSARDAAQPARRSFTTKCPGNIALDYHHGDAAKVAEAFVKAAHVVKLPLINQRLVVASMEPRSAIGEYERKNEHWTLHSSSQGVVGMKNLLRDILNAPPEKVRVLTGNVGGSFGMKATPYPEYVCILHARENARPAGEMDRRALRQLRVRPSWPRLRHDGRSRLRQRRPDPGRPPHRLRQSRRLLRQLRTAAADGQRDQEHRQHVPHAAARSGDQMRVHQHDAGLRLSRRRAAPRARSAWSAPWITRPPNSASTVSNCASAISSRRARCRSRTPAGTTYDCGDFPGLFKEALERADVKGFKQRKRESKRSGKLRGLGLACFVETTAAMTQEMGGIRFNADGTVTIVTGTLDYGQGHASAFAQVLVEKLGVPFDRIRLMQGDSDQLVTGGGTGGSRSAMLSGTAIMQASDKVDRKRQADRRACAGSLRRRYRIQERALHHCRHRPLDRHHGAGRTRARRHQVAGRRSPTRST